MDTPIAGAPATPSNPQPDDISDPPFLISQIQVNDDDKLGNKVLEKLWYGNDYLIYRTCRGVFIHFSDCKDTEAKQREAFAEIIPELCELRYLTQEMRSGLPWYLFWRRRRSAPDGRDAANSSLFDHNIAQAITLVVEDSCTKGNKYKDGKAIAKEALEMAVVRCTNDNTIRYVGASMVAALIAAAAVIAAGAFKLRFPEILPGANPALPYFIAAFFGIVGAAFSVMTRVRSFQMKPCQQSDMNYLMARLRILIGLVAGLMLYLVLQHPLGKSGAGALNPGFLQDWGVVAIVGFVGGFAERLVPTVFRNAAAAIESSSGTPVQEIRRRDGDTGK